MPFDWWAEPVPGITSEQIAAALERAVEVVRPAVCPPKTVAATPLQPSTARSRTTQARETHEMRAPWCLVGYVSAHGEHGFYPVWAVWWHTADGRVWLKRDGP